MQKSVAVAVATGSHHHPNKKLDHKEKKSLTSLSFFFAPLFSKEEILSSIKTKAPPLETIQTKIERLLEASTLHLPLGHALIELI